MLAKPHFTAAAGLMVFWVKYWIIITVSGFGTCDIKIYADTWHKMYRFVLLKIAINK